MEWFRATINKYIDFSHFPRLKKNFQVLSDKVDSVLVLAKGEVDLKKVFIIDTNILRNARRS